MSIDDVGLSENRQTELRLGPKGRAVFTAKGWNDALRAAGLHAGNFWIATYGPLRWNRGYAIGQLGYFPRSKRHAARVTSGAEPPFFETGQMLASFNARARTEAVAKKGGARFWIVCPVGHPLNPVTADQFRTLPARERTAVAREYRRAVIQALMARRTTIANRQKAKAEARAQRRIDRNAARRAARAARRSAAIRPAA